MQSPSLHLPQDLTQGRVAGCQQSPVLYMQPAQESQKRLISLQRASVCDEAEMEVCDIITKNWENADDIKKKKKDETLPYQISSQRSESLC